MVYLEYGRAYYEFWTSYLEFGTLRLVFGINMEAPPTANKLASSIDAITISEI